MTPELPISSDDLGFMSAADLQAAYAARQLSPVEVARSLLDRIGALDGRFNAMVILTPEIALAQARASEAAYAGGGPVRPLEGVPVTMKDMHPTKALIGFRGGEAGTGKRG